MSSKVEAIKELIKHEHQKRIDNNDRDYSFFHPSEFHQCVRKICYKYYGVGNDNNVKKITTDLQRVFDNGFYMHKRYTDYFSNIGILYGVWQCKNPLCKELYGKQEKYGILKPDNCNKCGCNEYEYVEVELENKEHMIAGHFDGILRIGGDYCIIDYKSMHANNFSRLTEPLNKHIIQVSIYLWLSSLNHGFLLYENKDSQKIKLFQVDYDQKLIDKILKRSDGLRKIISNKKLPKRPFEKDSSQCRSCELRSICWKDSSK